jgi:hypothetical protein
MNSLRTKKIASILTTLTAAAALAMGTTGCRLSAGIDATDPYYSDPTPVASVAEIAIDTGATMSADPGNGVGVFVQYEAGGFWTVFTTCDTAITGAACDFDILVTGLDSRTQISNVEGFDLETGDTVSLNSDGSFQLVTSTTFGMNGIIFDADPGATMEIDILLDGGDRPELTYVVSDGVVLEGVPTNPIDLTPAIP